jgi:predicted Zn finger-like uncharacterized protein
MILTCPACQTRYEVDASKFPPQGRNVRCARCGEVWHQASPEQEGDAHAAEEAPAHAATPADYEPGSAPAEEPHPQYYAQPAYTQPGHSHPAARDEEPHAHEEYAEPAAPAQPAFVPRRIALAAGWGALAAAVVVICVAAVTYRQQIVQVWPQSASLYSRLGMKVNRAGLVIRDVKSTKDGQGVLTVTGELRNVSDHAQAVPQVRVALINRDKRELYHWTIAPAVMTLRPGQSTHFVAQLSSPPADVQDTQVRFAKAGE